MTQKQVIKKEPQDLIQKAIEKGVDVATIEKLLAMRKELKEEYAREEFYKSLAEFQRECPVIKRSKVVLNKDRKSVRYKYAPTEDILHSGEEGNTVQELLAKNGFSFVIFSNVDSEQKNMKATCRVFHKEGYYIDSDFVVPIGTEEFMSAPQKYAARLTFAKRYAFLDAFGIMTGDEDDDAQPVSDTKFDKVVEMLNKETDLKVLEEYKSKFKKSKKYTKEQKEKLEEQLDRRIEEIKESNKESKDEPKE